MKKQLLGIFLGLATLESVSVLHASRKPIVHFVADDYADEVDLGEDDLEGRPSFRPEYPRIKRDKLLPADEQFIEKQLKSQLSELIGSFDVKKQPAFLNTFKQALRTIKIGLANIVEDDAGLDSRSNPEDQKQQLVDKFAQNYQGDTLGVREAPDLTPKKDRDVLNGERSLAPEKSADEPAGESQNNPMVHDQNFKDFKNKAKEFANKALEQGKKGVEKVAKGINNVRNYFQGSGASDSIDLLSGDIESVSQNEKKSLSEAENNWRDILEGYLSKHTKMQNKAKTAIRELEKDSKTFELPNKDDVRAFVETLYQEKKISEKIYKEFNKEYNNFINKLDKDNSVPIADRTRSKS